MSRRAPQPHTTSTVFLDFPRSDGDQLVRPANTIYNVDAEGQINFHEPLDVEENGHAKKWRAAIGKAIATKLEMQGDCMPYVMPSDRPDSFLQAITTSYGAGQRAIKCIIITKDLRQIHGTMCTSMVGDVRLTLSTFDLSCLGYRSGRFRSINEFIPHAIWLFSDATMNYANCECKYCTKQPQKGITASMGDILGSPSSASPLPRVMREKPRERKTGRPHASVQKILQPALKPSSHIKNIPTLAERNSDLRAVFSRNSMKLKRWYRDGEIVWCRLSTPIQSPLDPNIQIEFWPGLVQECKLKAVPVLRDASSVNLNRSDSTPRPSFADSGAHEEERGIVNDKDQRLPFTVEQSTIYTVELFAVNKSIRVCDGQVIPYQAYIPPEEVIGAMQVIEPKHLNFDRDSVSSFNPCPSTQPPPFEDVVGPYAVALQIASNVSQFFSVTDEWEFTYSVPTSSTAPSPSQNQPDDSLITALNAAGRMNTIVASASSNTSRLYRNISGTQPGMPQSTLDRVADNLLGKGPGPTRLTRSQIRFQGLWWGPERIWVDDFVRLKVPRRCLAPYGSEDIFPPAGPGKRAIEAYKSTGRDVQEVGAGYRGVFMSIKALFVVEVMNEGNKKKECRASGPLFELVDDDWDESDDINVKQHKVHEKSITSTSRPIKPLPARTLSSSATQSISASTPETSHLIQPVNVVSMSSVPPEKTITSFSNYLPPEPPLGYRFRPILTSGYEAVISLSLLSGRYYPGLLMHPLLVVEMNRASQTPLEDGGILKWAHLWALDGLNGGHHCSVDPDKFKQSRSKMLEHSDKEAYRLLEAFKQKALDEMSGEEDEEEEVDMLVKNEDRLGDIQFTKYEDEDVIMN